jgi:hypothetical protein
MPNEKWTREQLLVVFRYYCYAPFGTFHKTHAEIKRLARMIGRTPDAVSFKGGQFASLDPLQRARGVRGFGNTSLADRALFAEFLHDPERIAAEAQAAYARLSGAEPADEADGAGESVEIGTVPGAALPPGIATQPPAGPSESERVVRVRRVQAFFRSVVLAAYRNRCAISGLRIRELLNASHIIPWNADVSRRADPTNGIALNAIYDRAFDRGLFTFDEECRVVLSPKLRDEMRDVRSEALPTAAKSRRRKTAGERRPPQDEGGPVPLDDLKHWFGIEGRPLELPGRFGLDRNALAWHRENVFVGTR